MVDGSTEVIINKGNLGADIFGGGEGTLNNDGIVSMSADVSDSTNVRINGGEFAVSYDDSKPQPYPFKEHYNIYGGGNVACKVGNTHVYVTKGMVSNASDGSTSFLDNGRFDSGEAGMAQAYYHEGQMYFCIFGGGYGKNTSVTGNTWVDFNISGMTDINSTAIEDDLLEYQSYLDVIGGGFNGTVAGNTNVHVGGNAMCRNVYGGGLYAAIGTPDDRDKGNTNVHITGGNIDNVYGGGVMGDILTSTNVNIGLKSDLNFDKDAEGNDRTYTPDNGKVTILMSVYGANDVSGHVPQANITHNGGTIDQNIYGAGNGDYRGYYTPGVCDYADGENDNYFPVDHSAEGGPKGNTYKGRPQTDNVSITLGGNSDSDKAKVLGQVFGGGNSCTIGKWKTIAKGDKHDGDPHAWRDDPDFFEGGGSVNITLNSHVKIGYDNTTLASASEDIKKMYIRDEENVSGLFMGCSGDVLATQSTAEDDYDYHHYYDSYTAKYWPGFAVFDNSGNPLSREEGLKSLKAYLNNILIWSNDVHLNITGSDIWIANFVGGGFRGSMKRKDGNAYQWTLPTGVTVGNCIIGGAYNTDVVYRVYDTKSDMHTYTETDGHYNYCTTIKPEWKEGIDYHHIEKDVDGNTTGIVRFMYAGGLLDKDGNPTDVVLNLNNNMDGGESAGVFGGCYSSGTVKNTEVNYRATGAHSVYGGGALANISGNSEVNLLGGNLTDAYGGGLGRKVDMVNRKTAVSALVYGDATVTLGEVSSIDPETGTKTYTASKVNGSIFGGNNVNGTPKGHVKVHVLKTMSRDQENRNTAGTPESFDVMAVYGGGSDAAYVPTSNDEKAEVLIEGCDNSIAYVYGGGNAAPVPATDVTIYGANAIDNAFAGGNGAGQSTDPSAPNYNPGADIGYKDYTRDEAHKYGAGTSSITVYGGTVNNVFGGSNTLGYIREHAYVNVPELPDGNEGAKCDLHLGNVHAGGNQAVMYCGGSVTLGCSEGAEVIYAGANSADIHGDIDLTITSGTYGKVFGGNNVSGNVYGHIKIDVDETGCWPIMIGELYGCGNDAAYSVYGYDDEGHCIESGEKLYDDPTINIYSCTSIGKIFGGGKGEGATVYGNPTVNVNTIKGMFAGQNPQPLYVLDNEYNRISNTETISIPDEVGTIGTIYGGGNAGAVYGSTTVNIGTLATNKHVSGTDTVTEKEVEVNITGNVFGGGNEAIVSGDTKVTIGKEDNK